MLNTILILDKSIFEYLNSWANYFSEAWKVLAIYGVYLIPLLLLWIWFKEAIVEYHLDQNLLKLAANFFKLLHLSVPDRCRRLKKFSLNLNQILIQKRIQQQPLCKQREISLTAALAGIAAWQGLNNFIGAFVIRTRPESLIDLNFPDTEFLLDRPGPSFPSDHTAFMVAVALTFWFQGKKNVAIFIGAFTALTMLARVVTAQHWPTDILVGAIVGVITAAVFWKFDGWIQSKIIVPLVNLAKRIGF